MTTFNELDMADEAARDFAKVQIGLFGRTLSPEEYDPFKNLDIWGECNYEDLVSFGKAFARYCGKQWVEPGS